MKCECDRVFEYSFEEGDFWECVNHLEELLVDQTMLQILLICPQTGRLWLKDYPHCNQQGGGPARYKQISPEKAKELFDWDGSKG